MIKAPVAERAHAILSASSSKQWLTCTPSARLSEQFPDKGSDFAAEGTLAHEMSELKLRKAFIEPMSTRAFNSKLKKLQEQLAEHPTWDNGMSRHTDAYLDFISQIVHSHTSPPYVAIEKRLDYSHYAPEGFGTGDCVIIAGNTLYINDLKYGKGVPVSAEGNTQMRLYALGAYREYSFLYPIETIRMAIIQPRLDSISEESLGVDELLAWGESIKPLAQKAFAGEGGFVPGEHCRFCRARYTCRARADTHTGLEDFRQMKPPILSRQEVGQILERAQYLAKWVSDLEDYALAECLSGADIPGWKAVEGRGSRQYVNQDTAFAALLAGGIEEAVLYERKPLTPAAVEKVLTKPVYKQLLADAGHVETKPGKPTLALVSDKREAFKTAMSAEEAFKDKIGGTTNG